MKRLGVTWHATGLQDGSLFGRTELFMAGCLGTEDNELHLEINSLGPEICISEGCDQDQDHDDVLVARVGSKPCVR